MDEDEYAKRRRLAEEAAERAAQPVPFEEHTRADAERFEKRREEVRELYAEREQELIAALRGDTPTPNPDADLEKYFQREEDAARAELEKKREDRLAAIDREEQERLERTKALYGRE